MKAKAVIFDMDGTLVDSERLLIDCWRYTAEKHGFDYDRFVRTLTLSIGLSTNDTARIFESAYPEGFDYRGLHDETTEIFLQKILDGEMAPKPGAFELLDFLRERGVPMALGTSTKSFKAIPRLRMARMEAYFPVVVYGDMVKAGKPAPDIFLKCCAGLDLAPGEVFAVDDSNAGMEAAWRAGVRPLMVPDVMQPTELTRSRCEAVFSDLFETRAYLEEHLEL